MTVTTTNSSNSSTAGGSSAEFVFDFYLLDDSDLTVFADDVLVDPSLYSVVIELDGYGGTVTFDTAPVAGKVIALRRQMVQDQQTSYPEAGPFPPAAHERALDKLTMIAQEMNERVDLSNAYLDETLVAVAADAAQVAEDTAQVAEDRIAVASLTSFSEHSVASIAALASLTSHPATLYVRGRVTDGDGGDGMFVYRSGNFTAQVAADPLHGVFVPKSSDPSGLNGVWVRQYTIIYPDYFGDIPAAIEIIGDIADDLSRGSISLRPERYDITDTIEVDRKTFKFSGNNGEIKWEGTNADPMIHVVDSSRVRFEDLILLGDLSAPPTAAIYFEGKADSLTGTNENIVINGCVLGRRYTADTTTGGSSDATPYAKLQSGIVIGGTDGSNDEYSIENTQVHSCETIAIDFRNTQSIWSAIRNVLVNDSGIGFNVGCNLHFDNISTNRCSVADIKGIRDTENWINTFNAENSTRFIWSIGGASFFVRGGELLRDSDTAETIFRWENGGDMVLENLTVNNNGSGADTIYYRPGSLKGGVIKVGNCKINNGSLRDTWDIDTSASAAAPSVRVNIEHEDFKFVTNKPYTDRQITPPAIAAAASGFLSSGSADTPLQDFFNVAYQYDLQGQHLTVGPDAANQIRARVWNVTAAPITLGPGRFRWLNVSEHALSKASANINATVLTNNTGYTGTIALPGASLGDFVSVGSTAISPYILSAYVSAADTVSIRIHNATGGSGDPADTLFTVGKLTEFGRYKNTAAYTPAPIANAATVSFTVPVLGAQLGGHTFVAYTNDLAGLICTSHVSAPDVVTVVLTNYTGGSVTLGAGYFKVMVAF